MSNITSGRWLDDFNLEAAKDLQIPPLMPPSGEVQELVFFSNRQFSNWLADRVIAKIEAIPNWQKAQPIVLGSIARDEFCLNSDIDLICCGDEPSVAAFINQLQSLGLKVRCRVPQDLSDWTVGVQIFDVISMLKAKPLTTFAAQNIFQQQKYIFSRIKSLKLKLIKELKAERSQRHSRYDSIANFLEPNIKYGLGGLRDIEQGMQLYATFSADFFNADHAIKVIEYYKAFFITIRQRLHILGYKEILVAQVQEELAEWFGYSDAKAFMKQVQRGLSRVNFYVGWIFDWVQLSKSKRLKLHSQKISNAQQVFSFLKSDCSVVAQKLIRSKIDSIFSETKKNSIQLKKQKLKILDFVLDQMTSEDVLVACFQSRLIDKLIPEITRLVGYVQHDQYHRYAADIHIQQACRELKRVYVGKSRLGSLDKNAKKFFVEFDWRVLKWTCLLHDIGKGLGTDHSLWGAKFTKEFLRDLGLGSDLIEEVAWMVQNHLMLSQSAFRKSAASVDLLKDLMDKDFTIQRARRLAVFTAIDIKASNPEAWSDWKEKLLNQVLQMFSTSSVQSLVNLKSELGKAKAALGLFQNLLEFDPVVLRMLTPKLLAKDLVYLAKIKGDGSVRVDVKVIKANSTDLWVRIFSSSDRMGFLNDVLQIFIGLGVATKHAGVCSIPGFGVYDWFLVRTQKSPPQLKKSISEKLTQSAPLQHQLQKNPLKISKVEIVEIRTDHWVLSLKGPDQSGFLAFAVNALVGLNLDIESASVHTWGREVEDILVIKKDLRDPEEILKQIENQFFLLPEMPV